MDNLKYLFALCLMHLTFSVKSETIDTAATRAYIQQYKDIAIEEMERTGVPVSITLAQGIHESGLGKSYLAQQTNNHFGIKCHETWTGKTFKYTDDAPDECFRVYDKPEDSYRDHSNFLLNRPRYAGLFLFAKNDYKAWSYGLKKAGYATNPKYPEILIKTIEDFQLYLFDKGQSPSYINSNPPQVVIEKEGNEEYPVSDSMGIDIPKNKPEEKTEETPVVNVKVKEPVFSGPVNKKIIRINKRKAVKIYKNETLELIGSILSISKEDLLLYNDIQDESVIKDGSVLFIEPKKRRNKEGTYKMKAADNMWSISQKKGIQLTALLNRNKLVMGEEPAAKEIIYLKGVTANKPALRPKPEMKKQIVSNPEIPVITDIMKNTNADIQKPVQPEAKTAEKDLSTVIPVIDSVKAKTIAPPETSGTSSNNINSSTPQAVSAEPKTIYPAVIDYNNLPKSTTGSHLVIKGDTIYNISKRYNISIANIIEWNNLSDQNIKLGQVLKIQP